MKIECLPVHGRKQQFLIACDDEPWREIHSTIFGYRPAVPSNCPTMDDWVQLFSKLEYKQAKIYAIKRLSLQSMHSSGLLRAFRDRLVSEATAQRVVDEFMQQGYLNDEEWTKSYIRQQSARKLGPRAIAQKLICKGVDKEEMAEALKATSGSDVQKHAIAQLLTTKYRQRNLSDFKERQKVVGALMRRGFDLPIILDSLKISFDDEM